MDEISNQFEEIDEISEARSMEQQSLDDATLQPGTYLEQNSSYQQAEEIQSDLVDISRNALEPGADEGASPLPLPGPEDKLLEEDRSELKVESSVETAEQIENLRTLSRTLSDISTKGKSSDPQSIQIASRQMNELADKFEDLFSSPNQEMDNDADISIRSHQLMLKLQAAMDKKDQAEKVLSNVLTTFSDTQRDLVSNLK